MAWILSGDPRLGPLAGGPTAQGPLAGSGYSPDFSIADPAALDLTPRNPMAVNWLEALHQALPEAAARARVAQWQPGTPQPGLIHDVGYGYGGPLGGAVADMLQPPRTGEEAALMFGMPGVGAFTGPAKFETQVGYHLKDVDRGPLLSLDRTTQRARNRAVDTQDWDEVELPLRSINGTQLKVNPDYAEVPKKNPELPLVIKTGGQYYAQDGHHRLVAAAADGKQTAKVRLIDLDKTSDPSTPLLDWTPSQ